MILPLFVSLLFAPQAAVDSGSLTLRNGANESLLKSGQYFKYVRVIEQQLAETPSDAGLHASLALGYYMLGQRRFCSEEIQQALALLKDSVASDVSAQIHYLAGRFEMENTKYLSAAGHLEAALRKDPANSKVEYFLAVCLQTLNQQADARSHFAHACSAGVFAWPCRALAEIDLDDRNLIAAREHAGKAIQIDPASAEAQLVAGKAAQSLGDFAAAQSFFTRAAELDSTWEVPHYFLGHLYQKMSGMADKASHELAVFQELYDAAQ